MKYQVGDKVRLGEEILAMGKPEVMRPFVGQIGTVENVLEIHPVLYEVRLNAAVVFTLRAGEIHPVKIEQPKPDTLETARLLVTQEVMARRDSCLGIAGFGSRSTHDRAGHELVAALYTDLLTEIHRIFDGMRDEANMEREA